MDINETFSSENMKRSRKKNKFPIIALSVVIIVAIAITILVSGVFKSDGQKFIELLTEDQYVVKMYNERKEEFSTDGERNYNLTVKKDVLTLLGIPIILVGDDIILEGNVIIDGENLDSNLTLSLGETEIQKAEMIKDKELTAFNIPNMFETYIAVKNDNLEEAAKKLGYISGDESANENLLDETKKIATKYAKVLAKSINDYIEIEKNVEVDINENTLKTDQFKLSLGTIELNNIYLELLKELKDDDETLRFIVINYIEPSLSEETSSEQLSTEELVAQLKTEINDLYNEKVNVQFEEDEIEENVLTIYAYSYKNKNVKTALDLNMKDAKYNITLETMSDAEEDYILLTSVDSLGTKIDLKYIGQSVQNEYSGEVTIGANTALISLANINVQKIENSEAKARRVEELNALLINDATDEEIANIKKQLDEENNNQGNDTIIDKEEDKLYEEGEFKLDDPENQIKVLQNSIEAYNKLTPGITKDEAIAILGEPGKTEVVGSTEYIYWFQYDNIYLVSVGVRKDTVYDVYNDIVSSMRDNVQVSMEIATEIEDLNTLIKNVNTTMYKQDVINVLGDKYVETNKDTMGYSTIKWYDKKENSVEIEFDKTGKAWYINKVSADK